MASGPTGRRRDFGRFASNLSRGARMKEAVRTKSDKELIEEYIAEHGVKHCETAPDSAKVLWRLLQRLG